MNDIIKNLDNQIIWEKYQAGENDMISGWIYEITESIRLLFRKHDESIEEQIREIKKNWQQIILEEESGEYFVHYQVGQLSGVIESLEEYFLSDEYKAGKLTNEMISSKIEDLPHINEILIRINEADGIRHGKLADMIGIDKSTLTPIMAKLEKAKVVRVTSVGKYKYYYITSLGKRYLSTKDTDNISENGTDVLIERLRIALEQSDDPDALISKIDKMIKNGVHKSTLYKSTIKKRRIEIGKGIYSDYGKMSRFPEMETHPKKVIAKEYPMDNGNYKVEISQMFEKLSMVG